MKRLTTCLAQRLALALVLVWITADAIAQEPAADDLIGSMQEIIDTAADVSFLATGELRAADGTIHTLELEVEAMPGEGIVRLFILQPDALADNFIIVTKDDLYNYNYLTNQIVVYDSGDPQAYGPLAGNGDTAFELTLDLSELFAGWFSEVAGQVDTPAGPAWQLEFSNIDPQANIARATVTVLQESSFPHEVTVLRQSGEPMLRIELSLVEFDNGFTADDLLWYPPDAELIDER